jgi:hypothetical protein
MSVGTARTNQASPAPSKSMDRRALILAACWLMLGVLGWLDDITGYELSLLVFYSVPVGLAAWHVGRWSAICVALGATVACLLADYFSGEKYSARYLYYWNGTIHFLAFVINAVTISKIKSDLDQKHRLAAELASAREALQAVSARLPNCPVCGKLREQADHGGAAEFAKLTVDHPEAADILCTDCRANPDSVKSPTPTTSG